MVHVLMEVLDVLVATHQERVTNARGTSGCWIERLGVPQAAYCAAMTDTPRVTLVPSPKPLHTPLPLTSVARRPKEHGAWNSTKPGSALKA